MPLFLPENIRIDNVIRAMAASPSSPPPTWPRTCAAACRPSPTGQVEAAQAIGLRGWQINLYIVLPQALRITIPANVGQFISLLKDTTLVYIIGLIEILGIGRAGAGTAGVAGRVLRGLPLRGGGVLRPQLHAFAGKLSS